MLADDDVEELPVEEICLSERAGAAEDRQLLTGGPRRRSSGR